MKFLFRKEINLRTKYKNKSECLNNCRDINNNTYRTSLFSKEIRGEVNLENSTFRLSSIGKNASAVVFRGEIHEEEGTILMRGEIKPKLFSVFLLYGLRAIAIYTLVTGFIDLYSNRTFIGNLYDPLLILIVSCIAIYFVPQLLFYICYKSLINNINEKVNT